MVNIENLAKFIFYTEDEGGTISRTTSIPILLNAGFSVDNHCIMATADDWNGGTIGLQIAQTKNSLHWVNLSIGNNTSNPTSVLTTDDNQSYITQENSGLILVDNSSVIFNHNSYINVSSFRKYWIRAVINDLQKTPKGLLITIN